MYFPIIFEVIYILHHFAFFQEKPKMGTMESLKFLMSSRYIRDLATLVVAYGISINLVEVTWKSKLKAQVIYHLFQFWFSYCLFVVLFFSLIHTSENCAVS